MKSHIVVLGAGPAGLSAAWQLAIAGHQVTVLEKDCRVGGLCQTVPYNNFRFDLGGHRFFSQNESLVHKITNLMGDTFTVRPRKSVIRLQNKYFKYPIDLPDLLANLKPQTTLNCMLGYGIQSIKNRIQTPPDSTYEQWLVNRFGRPLYNLYFAPYSEKLWGTTMDKLSSDWAAQRISKLSFTAVLKSILNRNKNIVRTFTKNFFYPMEGIGQISEKMTQMITLNNGQVLLNSEVVEVHMESQPCLVKYRTPEGIRSLNADSIISTIPVTDFAQGFYPQLNHQLSRLVRQLQFRSLIFLNIMFDQPLISDNTWIYVPEKKFQIMRLQEPKNWYHTNAPENKTSIICEIACNFNDETWRADKHELYEKCISELEILGFTGLRQKTLDYFTTYAQHAYPVYFLGYRNVIDKVIRHFDSFKHLILCGRQGLYRYNNMDHAIEMGLSAADVILKQAEKQTIYKIADDQVYLETNHVITKNKKTSLQA